MSRFFSRSILASLLVVGLSAGVSAQEIDATVQVNNDRLSLNGQQETAGFGDELQRYINTMRWTNSEWGDNRIKMTVNVVFDGDAEGGLYSAKLLIGSQRSIYHSESRSPMLKILDDQWVFHYVRNQPFQQNPTSYDELTGPIDFYVYTAIGLDLDSYGLLGGNAMYEKAREIAQRAQLKSDAPGWSTNASPGKFTRNNLIRELTEVRYAPIRKFIYDYHYRGLDLRAKNASAALDSINNDLSDLVRAIDRLVEPSTLIRVITDAKNVEFAELFAGYPDELVWRKLSYIDKGHADVYEAARNR